jgi:uncharacterized tellurite resistance protein B-like protein
MSGHTSGPADFKIKIMTPTENLHYAMGELAYAVARADGAVQKEERQKFQDIVESEIKSDPAFDIADIVFKLMDRDKRDTQTVYQWAIKQIKLNSHYLSPKLKDTYTRVMEKVAEAFPPVTKGEQKLIDRFKKDIEPLHGDPVYYAA